MKFLAALCFKILIARYKLILTSISGLTFPLRRDLSFASTSDFGLRSPVFRLRSPVSRHHSLSACYQFHQPVIEIIGSPASL
jgi:hypothetical protein